MNLKLDRIELLILEQLNTYLLSKSQLIQPNYSTTIQPLFNHYATTTYWLYSLLNEEDHNPCINRLFIIKCRFSARILRYMTVTWNSW